MYVVTCEMLFVQNFPELFYFYLRGEASTDQRQIPVIPTLSLFEPIGMQSGPERRRARLAAGSSHHGAGERASGRVTGL